MMMLEKAIKEEKVVKLEREVERLRTVEAEVTAHPITKNKKTLQELKSISKASGLN